MRRVLAASDDGTALAASTPADPGQTMRDEGSSSSRRAILYGALAAASARIVGAALVRFLGFRAVSDDDFARVVIAQRFAASPHLDPSGTSWLPLPFWLVGGAMTLLGPSLEVARVLAWSGAAIFGALVAAIAIASGVAPRRAIAASIVAAAMPWGMQLAVATVPEAPAAACAAAGAIALSSTSSRIRVVGALALLSSCWSRYDAWPIAAAFAALCLVDARRAAGADRIRLAVAAAIAIAGPLSWTSWQAIVYHDPFRYLRLVRSYRQALGPGPSIGQRLLGYPAGLFEEMREVIGAAIVGASAWTVVRRRAWQEASAIARRWQRPLLVALLQVAVLVAGDVRDGAPTHHPERALLGPATIVLFASGDAIGAWISVAKSAVARALIVVFCVASLAGYISLRLQRSLPWYSSAPRARELAAGRALSRANAEGASILIDTRDLDGGYLDYGYYALLAAYGRPNDAVVDRDQDPRHVRGPSSFETPQSLRARVSEANARVLLAWGPRHRAVAESIGARLIEEENPAAAADPEAYRWAIFALDDARP